MESNNGEVFMGIDKNEWGFRVGHLPHGERNKISDVPGVTVGHCTLADGDIQTGVTALLPHPGDVFHDKVLAACHVINGFGKTTGLVQIDELGTLETPILFTNTLSVGTVETALAKYMLQRNPDIILLPTGEKISRVRTNEQITAINGVAEGFITFYNNRLTAVIVPIDKSATEDIFKRRIDKYNEKKGYRWEIQKIVLRKEPLPRKSDGTVDEEAVCEFIGV
mgnify:CR=1 FL=1